ncbi:MAG: signal recognition particle-docking protein FtsY [Acidimicrobiales bacterium]
MTALYIVLSVVVVVVLAVLVVLAARRRRSVEAAPPGPNAPPPTTTPPRGAAPPGPAAAPVGAPAPEAQPVTPAPRSFRDGLGKTRGLFSPLRALRSRGTVEAATWEELEEALLRADVGVGTTDALLADLRRKVKSKEVAGGDQLLDSLRADLVDLLRIEGRWDAATDGELALSSPESPGVDDEEVEPVGRSLRFDAGPGVVNVWLFVGVNGVGKTTTIGKLARQQSADGRSVLLAAGDTFRAAAGEQLARWAERAGTEIVRGAEGGDPSAIVFDAVQRAAARGNDLVLADTAGRLHTKVNLVEELKKIRRVADRPPGRVTEVLLVIDATTGQNGLVQAKEFTDAVEVTGLVLTKLDGTAKGGVVVAVQRELGLPVKLVGLGEGPDDLVPFDPEQFVDALLG